MCSERPGGSASELRVASLPHVCDTHTKKRGFQWQVSQSTHSGMSCFLLLVKKRQRSNLSVTSDLISLLSWRAIFHTRRRRHMLPCLSVLFIYSWGWEVRGFGGGGWLVLSIHNQHKWLQVIINIIPKKRKRFSRLGPTLHHLSLYTQQK